MENIPLLSCLIIIPLLGALIIALFTKNQKPKDSSYAPKFIAMAASVITFVLSLLMLFYFKSYEAGYQFHEHSHLIKNSFLNYKLGVDGISIYFVLLTTILTPICLLASWENVKTRVREYVICFLLLESFVIGVFCALDMLLFYVFFEVLLIPMFFIIGIWGGENKVYATLKFFLYTLAGSLLFLLAIIYIYKTSATFDFEYLTQYLPNLPPDTQKILWLLMFASFAVKVPMWPVHTWLPDAHVEAPTAGSVILAGILLKVGAYGFIRVSLPMLPAASLYFSTFVLVLSAIAVIYASLLAFAQTNMKKLIAYSSIAHMGYVTMGIFAMNMQAMMGALVQMISHGIVSAALFLIVGVMYDRMHSKEISEYGGVAQVMPKFALIFMIFTMASVGLPGTSGFVGEISVLIGTYSVSKIATFMISLGLVLGAAYMLILYKKLMFGEIINAKVKLMPDLTLREVVIFAPLIIMVIVIGVYPKIITEYCNLSVDQLISHVVARR